jgi:hypothetical protein
MREKLTRRVAVIVGTTVLALSGGAYAVAQSGDSPKDERKALLDDAAQRLDVTPQKLTQALKDAAIARIDAAVKAGRLTKAQGDEMKQHVNAGELPFLGGPRGPGGPHGGPGHRGGPPPGIAAAESYLGLSRAELRKQLEGGKSLADVAKAQNKSVDGLESAMEKAIRADIAEAVDDKKLTQAQADQILKDLPQRLADRIKDKHPGGPGHGPGRHGGRFGPGGPGGPPPPGGDRDGDGDHGFGPPPGAPPPAAGGDNG